MGTLWPFIVIGVFSGSIYGLATMGVVLTYKTTGIFNFAYGAVAMFCAFTYWQLHDSWHLTAWVALPILLLVVAPVLGLVFEGIFRAFAGASAEIPMVVTLAMLAVLEVGATLIWGGVDRQLQSIFPRSTFLLSGNLHVGWDQLGTLLVSLAMGAGLWWLLRHTRFGTATRAVVDNGDLAEIIGVNAGSVRRGAWIVSSMFGALVGVLLSPSQGLDVYQLVVVVIYVFAPAVLGFVFGLPWAFGGALVLGITQSVLSRWSSSGTVADLETAIPYIALFVLLIVLGNRLKEAGVAVRPMAASTTDETSSVPATTSGVPGRSRSGGRALRPLGIGLIGFVLAVLLPIAVPGPRLGDVTIGAIFAMVALTLVVLSGWAGQISLCQFSFVGVGAFCVGHLAGAHGQSFVSATLVGMAISVGLGLLVGLASLRLSGLYLMIATLAFALIMDNVVFNRPDVSGGLTGMTDARPRILGVSFTGRIGLYELVTVVFAVLATASYFLNRGPVGRRLHILRDSPVAASTLGVNLTVTKLVTFAVCGAIAALGGAFYGSYVQAINPMDFQFSVSLELLLLVVLGGRTMISGAVIAGAVFGIQHLPIPVDVVNYISLGVAAGVVGLASTPEGTVAVSVAQARKCFTVLRPRPRRPLVLEPLLAMHEPVLATHKQLEVTSGR
ncbi:MAG TPA: ABC transporter permease [Acidimicrobiales bacterium]|nr:ABC transporter permease [Acidimicrobiales bacterium]